MASHEEGFSLRSKLFIAIGVLVLTAIFWRRFDLWYLNAFFILILLTVTVAFFDRNLGVLYVHHLPEFGGFFFGGFYVGSIHESPVLIVLSYVAVVVCFALFDMIMQRRKLGTISFRITAIQGVVFVGLLFVGTLSGWFLE